MFKGWSAWIVCQHSSEPISLISFWWTPAAQTCGHEIIIRLKMVKRSPILLQKTRAGLRCMFVCQEAKDVKLCFEKTKWKDESWFLSNSRAKHFQTFWNSLTVLGWFFFFFFFFGRGSHWGSIIFSRKAVHRISSLSTSSVMLCGLLKNVDSRVQQLLARKVSVIDFLCLVISTRVVGLVMLLVD